MWNRLYFKYIIFITIFLNFGCSRSSEMSLMALNYNDDNINASSEYMLVLGDLQEYTGNAKYYPYFQRTVDWIGGQIQGKKKINSVLQVGDVTSVNTDMQWELYKTEMAKISNDVLCITCTGNHDYTWDGNYKINDRNSTLINKYASFPFTKSNIIEYFESGKMENIVVRNSIKGERYDILVLEFGPRTEVVEWANNYVCMHPDIKYILMTHEFLTRDGARIDKNSYAERQYRGTTWSSPENIWNNLVKDNDNIVCVLCGHNGFSTQLFSENTAGRQVPQILFNLQYQENGGDGWIQLWEFEEQSDSVNVSVYNTIHHKWHNDPSTSFKFRYRY